MDPTWRPKQDGGADIPTMRRPLRSGPGPQLADLSPSPAPSTSFTVAVDDGQVSVPDSAGAVGPEHVLTALNTSVTVSRRDGRPLLESTLDAFFSALDANIFCYDPRCLFDPYSRRWILTAGANPGQADSGMVVAVSVGEDPTLDWYRYYIPLGGEASVSADSPNLGFNSKWIAIQANVFDLQTGLFFESQVLALDKTNFYSGGSGDFSRFRLAAAEYGASQVPATTYDPQQPSLYFVKNWNGNFMDPAGGSACGFLRIFTLSGELGQETFTAGEFVGTDQQPGVSKFTWADSLLGEADLGDQKGSTNRIQLGDSRIQSLVFRGGTLWTCQTVLLPAQAPTRSGVQWWEFGVDGRLFQRYEIQDPTGVWSYAYPSASVNNHFDVLLGYNAFSKLIYPSAYYSFFPSMGLINEAQTPMLMRPGTGPYVERFNVQNRWGDWSVTCVDPMNDGAFWTLQEIAVEPSELDQGRWSLQWARIVPSYDIELSARVSASQGVPGQPLVWTLSLTNRALSFSYGAKVTASLPLGFILEKVTPSEGAATVVNGVLTWRVDQLGVDAAFCQITGRISGDSLKLTLTASVVGTGLEEVLSNNTTSTSLDLVDAPPIVQPDLLVMPTPGLLSLSWPVGYIGFGVERLESLNSESWVPVGSVVEQNESRRWVLVPVVDRQAYFRLRRQP